ncbi:MAG: mechanosensitive ion channel family protein [Pseudomonadota bacterium]
MTVNEIARALLLAALLQVLPHAPIFAQTASETNATTAEIEVGSRAATDREIAARIRQVLSEIEGYDRVDVSVSAGVVTLAGEVIDGAAEDELTQIISRVAGVVAIENELRQSGDLNERLAPAIDRVFDRGETVLVNTPIFLVALAVFLTVAAFGWLVTMRLTLWKRFAPNSFIAEIYRAVARIGFVILGLVIALDILNATALIGAVLGAAGVVGLAVGFAVRDTVENFIASILLSLRQPFRPNDFVEIAGDMGNVARLTSRATILISPDGNHIRIPNATVFKGRIVNYSRDPNRRFTFDLGVDAESDLAAALSTSVTALESLPFLLNDPPVGAWIERVGDSNVILTFSGWVNQRETDFLKARGEAIRVTKAALEAAGFGLPEPTYRLKVDSGRRPLSEPERHTLALAPSPLGEDDIELPAAAAPDVVEQATEEAVDRERLAKDGSADLLSETRGQE